MLRSRSICAACCKTLFLTTSRTPATSARTYLPQFFARRHQYSTFPAIKEQNEASSISANIIQHKKNAELLSNVKKAMKRTIELASMNRISDRAAINRVLALASKLDQANVRFDANTYELILRAYARAGDIDQVMPLLNDMLDSNVQPTIEFFDNSLQLISRSDDVKLQARVLQEMENAGYRTNTRVVYNSLLTCMRNNGEVERAFETLEKMKSEGITPTLEIYRQLFDLCIHYNHPDAAYSLLKEAELLKSFDERQHYMYMEVLRSAALNSSHAIVKDMWKTAVLDHNIEPDEGLCHYILHVAAHHGDSELGSDVIRMIGKFGYPYKETHFASLIEAFAATGDWKSTLKVLHLMRAAGITPTQRTAYPIANKLGKDLEAVRLAQKALYQLEKESALDILAFNVVIHSFAYNGEFSDAMETFGRAAELRVTIDLETIHAALDACIHAKEAIIGVKIFEKYVQGDLAPNATTMSKMVTLMCSQDDYEDAFKYLEQMKSMGFVPLRGCYYRLVKKLASKQDSRLQLALDDMKACGYELTSYVEVYLERHAPRY